MKILALITRNLLLLNNRNLRLSLFSTTDDQINCSSSNNIFNMKNIDGMGAIMNEFEAPPGQIFKLVPITMKEAARLPIDQIVIGNKLNASISSAIPNTFTSYFDYIVTVQLNIYLSHSY